MSTLALNKLLEYILSLSLSNKNKDWLASKIIESKTGDKADSISASSFYGSWKDDSYCCDEMLSDIKNSRSFKKGIVEL